MAPAGIRVGAVFVCEMEVFGRETGGMILSLFMDVNVKQVCKIAAKNSGLVFKANLFHHFIFNRHASYANVTRFVFLLGGLLGINYTLSVFLNANLYFNFIFYLLVPDFTLIVFKLAIEQNHTIQLKK